MLRFIHTFPTTFTDTGGPIYFRGNNLAVLYADPQQGDKVSASLLNLDTGRIFAKFQMRQPEGGILWIQLFEHGEELSLGIGSNLSDTQFYSLFRAK
jgi:hypothetical protein